MKVSENWLRSWVNPEVDTNTLCEQLTMAGLEIDGVEPAAESFSGVVVAQIVDLKPHPDADKLKICEVDSGDGENIQIVCGAPNVYLGMKAPLAQVGAILPGGIKIKKAKLRGEVSYGMLCSASELRIHEDASGLMDLPEDAPTGLELAEYLQLDDHIIDIDLTPNRGDCLGVRGVAREIATINRLEFDDVSVHPVAPVHDQRLAINIEASKGCGRYVGRVITSIDATAKTPLWMIERLRRSGIRSINVVVDVTNYVLIELGHPMHGFDLRQLQGGIHIRWAKENEKLVLLDGQKVDLSSDVLLIADDVKPVAIAGIMGGEHSGVADDTTDVFLESAWFNPLAIVGKARRFGLHTDASHRYERGVDPELQILAMERASELLIQIAGGEAGPLVIAETTSGLPRRKSVKLRLERISKVLGFEMKSSEIEDVFARLGMDCQTVSAGTWEITPPGFRFDINIEEDLIEEIARIYGYNNIQGDNPQAPLKMHPVPESDIGLASFKQVLIERGFQEVINYSFVEQQKEQQLHPEYQPLAIINPISTDLGVMRVSLWQGLLNTLSLNLRHQQSRVRIFETGLRFVPEKDQLSQQAVISGLIYGEQLPQPLYDGHGVDFFDLKAVVESLLAITNQSQKFTFIKDQHPALHPGQTAKIILDDETVGWLGTVHPEICQQYSLKKDAFLFELSLDSLSHREIPEFEPWSKFPSSARDLSVVVNEEVQISKLLEVIQCARTKYLQNARIFDIYRGKGVDLGRKSVALDLIFSESSRTLNDEEVNKEMEAIISALELELNATLRE